MDTPQWLIDFLDGISLWDAIAIISVITAVVWFIAKKGWRGATAFARAILATATVIDNVKELPAFIERTDARLQQNTKALEDHTVQLDGIAHETNPNSGTSMKDALGRLEAFAKRMEESVEGIHGRLDTLESSVANLNDEDKKLWAAVHEEGTN